MLFTVWLIIAMFRKEAVGRTSHENLVIGSGRLYTQAVTGKRTKEPHEPFGVFPETQARREAQRP
jgi:hypothetical protein